MRSPCASLPLNSGLDCFCNKALSASLRRFSVSISRPMAACSPRNPVKSACTCSSATRIAASSLSLTASGKASSCAAGSDFCHSPLRASTWAMAVSNCVSCASDGTEPALSSDWAKTAETQKQKKKKKARICQGRKAEKGGYCSGLPRKTVLGAVWENMGNAFAGCYDCNSLRGARICPAFSCAPKRASICVSICCALSVWPVLARARAARR